ncbi:malto-oligosyltrehalose trehalohydrolase [Candidatus Methylocalor cossyra]|uniref:Malto-oligosyltrehalose trehalohydrolase n=1 Tax=Candidatus Methylocalor cossyra TaxID=3108543 RepID=A0ABP1C5U9_9GAMM
MLHTMHEMPFGAAVTAEGTRFRLWAPAATRVDLLLEGPGESSELPMAALGEGWFQRVVAEAKPGTRYRFRLDGGLCVPDPASRWNPDDVHGPSVVVDPRQFAWSDQGWRGRPWEEAVIYELHLGTFTPEGSFRAAADKLDYLVELGVTALEIMPVADFPGRRNWGYDGVLPFAPDASYGTPDDFKALIQAAHGKGLMVFLDVVYNHFGPEGNYLYVYARPFFSRRHHTPWGSAINFDGEDARTVRDFFLHNALYWLEEYRLDGLRLDAVHTIADDSRPDILEELAERVRSGPGRERHIHLILENDANAARYLTRTREGVARHYEAQWNDDLHHALHVLLTGESDGYYQDYAATPLAHLGRALREGFAFQGEPSPYRGGRPRGEPSRELPPSAFVAFLQTHDQVGNRAFGERLAQLTQPRPLRAAVALVLLAPSPPLLFMGEEFACPTPFRYFCDFGPELAAAVTFGRREEFAGFARFADPAVRETIPDPCAPATFLESKLNWEVLDWPRHAQWRAFYRDLLALRQRWIVPLLSQIRPGRARSVELGERALQVTWPLSGGGALTLLSNLGSQLVTGVERPAGELLAASEGDAAGALEAGRLAPWCTLWYLAAAEPVHA